MEMLHVHLLSAPEGEAFKLLKSRLAENICVTSGPESPSPARYEVLVAGRPSRQHLQASPNLRMLVIPFAGLPAVTGELLREYPSLAVHNLHHNAGLTAEMAVTLMLAAAKFIVPCDRALRENDWRPRYNPPPAVSLQGKTALVLGFGHVGQRIGRSCHALGMRVLAVRRTPGKEFPRLDFPVEVHGVEDMPALFQQVDVLLIALPATPETEGMIGVAQLRRLPPGAVLVNVGRGAIVDQVALYQALRDGHLRAAGLDVWYHYPLGEDAWGYTPPADFPFHELDNVVMSPHRAGASTETEKLRMSHLAELLNTVARGEPAPNRVDVEAGY